MPVDEPIVAIELLLLLHAPPAVVSFKFIVEPTHTGFVPVIAVIGLTVTIVVVKQPVLSKYVIVVVPAAIPVTLPDDPIVAIAVLLLLHEPLPDALLNVVVKPTHTFAMPEMAVGNGLIVTTDVALQPVGNK